MQPVIVDYDKCNADGICADVCPRKLIVIDDEDSKPRPIPEAAELCINCGHCLAVCPTSAITLNGMAPENCPPVKKALRPDYEQLDQLLTSKRSIRVYKDKPVDFKIIETLLETCRYAPSGSNWQPVNWIIATGSRPALPPVEGLADVPYWTNETVFSQKKLPKNLIVLGGGPIGLEIAQAFQRLGSRVTIIEFMDQILGPEDPDIAQILMETFQWASSGHELLTAKILRVELKFP